MGVIKSCSESEFNNNNAVETGACALQIMAIASILPLTYSEICANAVALPDGFLRSGLQASVQLYDQVSALMRGRIKKEHAFD